ncbi:unnamed protein product [Caenorhabditis nigoni]
MNLPFSINLRNVVLFEDLQECWDCIRLLWAQFDEILYMLMTRLERRSNVVTAAYFIGICISVLALLVILGWFILGYDTEVYYLYFLSWLYGGCQLIVSSRLGAFSVTIDLLSLFTSRFGNHVFRSLDLAPF